MYYQYIVKGLIILMAVIIDMRKYVKKSKRCMEEGTEYLYI